MKSLFIVIPILGIGAGAIKIGIPSLLVVVIAAVGIMTIAIAQNTMARRQARPISQARAADIEYYNRVRKEIGIDPYTPAELRSMREQDQTAQDKASREIAATFGDKTYRDRAGNLWDVYSNGYLS